MTSVVRETELKEGEEPPCSIWVEEPAVTWERTPEPLVKSGPPLELKEERVIEPELVIPVAAEMAPAELTWNWEEEPTERREEGVVVPIPTLPFAITLSAFDPTFKSDEKRFVDEAIVENRFVVVADVPVAFTKVKFWRVEEAFASNCWNEETAVVDVAMNESAMTFPATESF